MTVACLIRKKMLYFISRLGILELQMYILTRKNEIKYEIKAN